MERLVDRMSNNKRLDKGDNILVKAGLFYAYDGKSIKRTMVNRPEPYRGHFVSIDEDEIGLIVDVVELPIPDVYNGRHLIVQLKAGLIDIWTTQDQFKYRRV